MKLIFWNVDTQYDFMRNDESFKGALPIENARGIESNLEKLTEMAEDYQVKVVNTADLHNKDSEELSANPDYVNTFPDHCMRGTAGSGYIPATLPDNPYIIDWEHETFDEEAVKSHRNIVLYKDKFDIFAGNKHADKVVDVLEPDEVVVYGVATNVCVDQAVMGLLERGKKVYIATDAIKELPGLPLQEVLDKWEGEGAILTTTAGIEEYLKK